MLLSLVLAEDICKGSYEEAVIWENMTDTAVIDTYFEMNMSEEMTMTRHTVVIQPTVILH